MASRIEIKTQIKPFTTEEPQLLKFSTTTGSTCSFDVQKCETDIEAVDVAPYFYDNSPITQFCPKDGVNIMGTAGSASFRNSNLSGAVEVRGWGESYAFEGTKITSIKFLSNVYQYVCLNCKSLQIAYMLGTTTYAFEYFKNCTALKKIVLPENVELISKSMIPWEVSQAFRGTIVLTATTMEQANGIVGVSDLKYTDIECIDGTIHCE